MMIRTNVADDKTVLAEAIENEVTEYLIKSDQGLEEIIEKVKTKLQMVQKSA